MPGPPSAWAAMAVAVPLLLLWDLGYLSWSRKDRASAPPSPATALSKTALYVALAGAFAAALALGPGGQNGYAMGFGAVYLVEMALSVDNLFVFLLLFDACKVPPAQAHRVLNWGILGALVMRASFIAAGAAMLGQLWWLFNVVGCLLIVAGIKLLRAPAEHRPDMQKMWAVLLFQRIFRLASPEASQKSPGAFFVRDGGRPTATPLFLVLVAVEASDIVFAFDSVPASFALSDEPWLVFAANVWAILGLRSLYFAMAQVLSKLRYLRPALAVVLAFIGVKMLLHGFVEVPTGLSLATVVVILAIASAASFLFPKVH